MKYLEQMLIQTLEVIELSDEQAELESHTRELAGMYSDVTNMRAVRESIFSHFDPTVLGAANDTIQAWILHWAGQGKVRLVCRGEAINISDGGTIDAATNTYSDGIDSWAPVQVEWLEGSEQAPVVSSVRAQERLEREAALTHAVQANRDWFQIDGNHLRCSVTKAVLFDAYKKAGGGSYSTKETFGAWLTGNKAKPSGETVIARLYSDDKLTVAWQGRG